MDLSQTRWALSALAASDPTSSAADFQSYRIKAQRFLRLVQKHPDEDRIVPLGDGSVQQNPLYDGGFYLSPVSSICGLVSCQSIV